MNFLKHVFRNHWLGMVIGLPLAMLGLVLTVWLPYWLAFGYDVEPTPFYTSLFCVLAIVYGLLGAELGERAALAIRARRSGRRR